MHALRAFLIECAAAARRPAATVNVVLGNEAADMDSTVSALSLAFFWSQPQTSPSQPPALHIPVVNVPRCELGLRTDVRHQMERLGLWPHLVCVDDIDLAALAAAQQLRLTLVDHNALSAAQAGPLGGAVVALIDHHVDGGQQLDAHPRIVEPVGSCTSLVFREAIAGAGDALMDADWARLLLGPILLDTANLDASAARSAPLDRDVVRRLLPLALGVHGDWTPDATAPYYKELLKAKMDTSALTADELLRRDYKQWRGADGTVYGISAVAGTAQHWFERDPGVPQALAAFCRERALRVLFGMLYTDQPVFRRQLLVFWPAGEPVDDALVAHLEASELQLSRVLDRGGADAGHVRVYDQANVLCSRKQVQPIVQAFFDGRRA